MYAHPVPREFPALYGMLLVCLPLLGCQSAREQLAWQQLHEVEAAIRASSPTQPPPTLPADADLDAYLQLALLHSPDLKRAFEEWQAALLQAPQVFSLPDPSISFGVYAQEVETRVGPQRFRIGLRQKIPWLPRLFAGRDVALAGADVAEARFAAKKFRLFERVSHAYADYAYRGAGRAPRQLPHRQRRRGGGGRRWRAAAACTARCTRDPTGPRAAPAGRGRAMSGASPALRRRGLVDSVIHFCTTSW